jgi:hypothetical protein
MGKMERKRMVVRICVFDCFACKEEYELFELRIEWLKKEMDALWTTDPTSLCTGEDLSS